MTLVSTIMAVCMFVVFGVSLYTTKARSFVYLVPAICWAGASYLTYKGVTRPGVKAQDFSMGLFYGALGITWIALGIGYLFAI